MPTVSVIMPAYNAEPYLHAAVESVLRQSFADLELLIVDDGSSDRTVEIACGYADRDARVRVLEQANAGPGPARNTGFASACGRLFAFLDSDDEWDETFLEEQVAVLNARPDVDVVIGNARNRGGRRDGQPARPVRGDGRPITLAEILLDETSLFIMAVFRREVVDAIGGFDRAMFTNEEYDMWIRAAIAGFTFARHTKPLGRYACRPDSLSASDTRMLSGILRVFAKIRPSLAAGSAERTILDGQVARFEAELAAAEARRSLARGDGREAGRHVAALHASRGGWLLGAAATALAHAPALAAAAYRLRAGMRASRGSTAPGRHRPRPIQADRVTIASTKRAVRRLDTAIGRRIGPRRVIVDVRNSMHFAVLEPITTAFEHDPRVTVYYTSERLPALADVLAKIPGDHVITHRQAVLRRWDLYLSADPWTRPPLRRCARLANVFHGVAGKYDLDDPGHLPVEFKQFDRVLFINRDRLERYLARGIVSRSNAVLIGFPKVDRLVNGDYDPVAVRRGLGLLEERPTALYAPTWSPASSLNIAGEAIVTTLADAGWNVIVKLHSLSLDKDTPKFSGAIDWRARLAAIERAGQIVHVEDADASPLLAASDLMVTDHSTIGFEFCLLDRPLVVYDAPELIETARINPEKVRELRSVATVVRTVDELRTAVRDARQRPNRLSAERQRVASAMFHAPGGATARAVAAMYELLDLSAPSPHGVTRATGESRPGARPFARLSASRDDAMHAGSRTSGERPAPPATGDEQIYATRS
jgi:GT2 family glycosyltransferase